MYSKKVLKHFTKPHNYGKIRNADGVGKVGNIVCGDVMYLYIKVGNHPSHKASDGKEIIKDIKFETFGCTAAIATSSIITDLAKGKTFNQVLKIKGKKIVDALGGLPPIKIHCSVLAYDALVEAIYDYLNKNKKPISQEVKNLHQKIEEERKMIEEKYKDWVSNQTDLIEKKRKN